MEDEKKVKKPIGRQKGTKVVSVIPQGRRPNPVGAPKGVSKNGKKLGRPKRILTQEQIDRINQMLDEGKYMLYISKELKLHRTFVYPLAVAHYKKQQELERQRLADQELEQQIDEEEDSDNEDSDYISTRPTKKDRSLLYIGCGWDVDFLDIPELENINDIVLVDSMPNVKHYVKGQAGYNESLRFPQNLYEHFGKPVVTIPLPDGVIMTKHQCRWNDRKLTITLYVNCDADYFIFKELEKYEITDLLLKGYIPDHVRDIKVDSIWLHSETDQTGLDDIECTVIGPDDNVY